MKLYRFLTKSNLMKAFLVGGLSLSVVNLGAAWIKEYKSGIIWPEPPVVEAGAPDSAPSDAVVLFNGEDMSAWKGGDQWIVRDGHAVSAKTSITSLQSFGDCQLHLEFASPEVVKGTGQGRGNSGIHLMSRYEVQILDSFDNKTYFDGQCGAIYKQQPPMVNACRKPGEWQTLDILFTAPRFSDDGKLEKPGYVTVLHNGVMLHHHFELQGTTSYTEPAKYTKHDTREPIQLQFHGNPVRFRNIWVRENVQPLVGVKPEPKTAEPKNLDIKDSEPKKTDDKAK